MSHKNFWKRFAIFQYRKWKSQPMHLFITFYSIYKNLGNSRKRPPTGKMNQLSESLKVSICCNLAILGFQWCVCFSKLFQKSSFTIILIESARFFSNVLGGRIPSDCWQKMSTSLSAGKTFWATWFSQSWCGAVPGRTCYCTWIPGWTHYLKCVFSKPNCIERISCSPQKLIDHRNTVIILIIRPDNHEVINTLVNEFLIHDWYVY